MIMNTNKMGIITIIELTDKHARRWALGETEDTWHDKWIQGVIDKGSLVCRRLYSSNSCMVLKNVAS